MRSTFEKSGLIGSGVLIGVLISLNFSALAEKVSAQQLPIRTPEPIKPDFSKVERI